MDKDNILAARKEKTDLPRCARDYLTGGLNPIPLLKSTESPSAIPPEDENSREAKPNSPLLFPIDGMPDAMQNLVTECVAVYGTPIDLWAASFLAATAAGIGNSLTLIGRYSNNGALWWILVAPSGTGKSEPLDFAMKPLMERDAEKYRQFLEDSAPYRTAMGSLRKSRSGSETDLPPKPVCSQIILNDFTPEAMSEAHGKNPRGIAIVRDELMGWINDIGRYNKSGELETMYSIWSGKSAVINRKGQDPIRIEKPCITIAGGIVVDRLMDLARDGRMNNGMLPRCSFVWPEQCIRPLYSDRSLNKDHVQFYTAYIHQLLSRSGETKVILNREAEVMYKNFYNEITEESNNAKEDYIKEVYAKLDIMALRIALITHGMKMTLGGNKSQQIEPTTMEYAIRVAKYFKETALRVYAHLTKYPSHGVTKPDVILFCRDDLKKTNQSEVARFLGVSQQYVSRIYTTKPKL